MKLKLQKISKVSMAFLMALFSVSSWGQISVTTLPFSPAVTTFDSYDPTNATTANNTLPSGWSFSGPANYRGRGTGSGTSGGFYAFGASGDFSIGALRSGTSTYSYSVSYTNNSSKNITSLEISWNYEQWRFSNTSGWNCTGTGVLASNSVLNVADFSGTSSGTNGTVSSTPIALVLNDLNIAPGETFGITWNTSDQTGADNGVSIDDFMLKANGDSVWDGSAWINSAPTSSVNAIINGDYIGASFTANTVTVNSTKTLTISSGEAVTANNVTNNGAIVVNDGGNFIQNPSGTYSGTGTFTVNKNGSSVTNKYAFWSSPVASQNLTAIYPSATPSFITEYNTTTDYFVNAASTNSVFGKGYSIKTPAVSNVEFSGTPNNSTQTFTMSTAGNGYNLVGNPYPSNLDLVAFYNANSGRISSNFYFWDNTSNSVTIQGGATTTNIGYATYNPASQVWTPAPNITAIPTENSVKIGQGFIVKATNATDTSLSFSNDMRTAAPAIFYNKNNSSTEGKFWLRLNSSYNTSNTFAVAYLNSASDSFDQYDSKAIGTGSDAFYTIADAQKLVIQGKSAFDINDVVPVGTKHFQNGNFTISLVQKEGIFNNGQVIYLYDKVTGTYTDLQNSAYSFTANSGEVSSRFEIVYKLGVLSTSEVTKDSFEVYRNGENFFVRNNKNIESVIVYDASGRKIQTIEGGSKEIRITLNEKGVYIVKASSQGKEYTKKIIK